MGCSDIAKAPVSHGVEPHDLETGSGLRLGPAFPVRAARHLYRESGLVLGSRAVCRREKSDRLRWAGKRSFASVLRQQPSLSDAASCNSCLLLAQYVIVEYCGATRSGSKESSARSSMAARIPLARRTHAHGGRSMSFYRGMTCENVTINGDRRTPITAYVARPSGPSTTLALSCEWSVDLAAAVWASVGRSAGQGDDDGFSNRRQRRLRRAGRDSFFPRSRRRDEDAGGKRKRSWSSRRGDEGLATTAPRSGRGRVLP